MAVGFVVTGLLVILAVYYYIQFSKTPQPPAPTTTTTTTLSTKPRKWRSRTGNRTRGGGGEKLPQLVKVTKAIPTEETPPADSTKVFIPPGLRVKQESNGFDNEINKGIQSVHTPSIDYATHSMTKMTVNVWPRRRFQQPFENEKTKKRTMFEDDNIGRQRRYDSGDRIEEIYYQKTPSLYNKPYNKQSLDNTDDIYYQQTPSPFKRQFLTRRRFLDETLSWMSWVPATRTFKWKGEI